MKIIYIVFGQSGSRSNEDNNDWMVCAYPSPDLAEQHARKAQRIADRLYQANKMWVSLRLHTYREQTTWFDCFGDPRDGANRFDPGMRFNNYERVQYSVLPLPSLDVVSRLR